MTTEEMQKKIEQLEAEKQELKRAKAPLKASIQEDGTLQISASVSSEPIEGRDTKSGNHRYFDRYFAYFPVYDAENKKTGKRVKIDVIDNAGKKENNHE